MTYLKEKLVRLGRTLNFKIDQIKNVQITCKAQEPIVGPAMLDLNFELCLLLT